MAKNMSLSTAQLEQIASKVALLINPSTESKDTTESTSEVKEVITEEHKALLEEKVKLLKMAPKYVIMRGNKGRSKWVDTTAVRLERINDALNEFQKYSKHTSGNL